MVATTFTVPMNYNKWVKYLVLSVCVNALLILAIKVDKTPLSTLEIAVLKINLSALAAPVAEPVQKMTRKTASPQIVQKKNIITAREAQKAIPVTRKKPVAISKPEQAQEIKPDDQEAGKITSVAKQQSVKTATPDKQQGKARSTVIAEARYRRQTPLYYPRRALELGQQGTVIIHAQVSVEGQAVNLKIVDSSGYSRLDKAALAAVRKWEFEPVRYNGKSVMAWVKVPVKFIIQT